LIPNGNESKFRRDEVWLDGLKLTDAAELVADFIEGATVISWATSAVDDHMLNTILDCSTRRRTEIRGIKFFYASRHFFFEYFPMAVNSLQAVYATVFGDGLPAVLGPHTSEPAELKKCRVDVAQLSKIVEVLFQMGKDGVGEDPNKWLEAIMIGIVNDSRAHRYTGTLLEPLSRESRERGSLHGWDIARRETFISQRFSQLHRVGRGERALFV
jgi:hypothetical protein